MWVSFGMPVILPASTCDTWVFEHSAKWTPHR
jgi:hypothetical protein